MLGRRHPGLSFHFGPTGVLDHSPYADASGCNDVTRKLQRHGYTVIATANPLRGVDSDAAYLRSVLGHLDGPPPTARDRVVAVRRSAAS